MKSHIRKVVVKKIVNVVVTDNTRNPKQPVYLISATEHTSRSTENAPPMQITSNVATSTLFSTGWRRINDIQSACIHKQEGQEI